MILTDFHQVFPAFPGTLQFSRHFSDIFGGADQHAGGTGLGAL